jgi:hypothetical protein
MRAATAKKLRKIARSVGLPAKTQYAFAGKLRRYAGYRDESGVWQEGPPMPRPLIITQCFRRAYREAKKIYLGKPISALAAEGQKEETFAGKVVESVKEYANAPA